MFSVSTLFFGYYLNTYFNDAQIVGAAYYGGNPFHAMQTLANTFAVNQQVNTNLIFGDFISGLTVLFGILTGATISGMLSVLPFVDVSIQLLVQIIFSLSSLFLWVYIVSNRSV